MEAQQKNVQTVVTLIVRSSNESKRDRISGKRNENGFVISKEKMSSSSNKKTKNNGFRWIAGKNNQIENMGVPPKTVGLMTKCQ